MTGRKRIRGALQVVSAAALLVVGAWGLPDDVRAEPLAPTVAPARTVQAAAQQAMAPQGPAAVVVREGSFGRVSVEDAPQSFALDTTAHVFGWNEKAVDRATVQTPDQDSVTRLDSSPLPVAEGATHVETRFDGRTLVTVTTDAVRSVDEVAAFYTSAFDVSFDVLRAPERSGVTRLLVLTGSRIAGTVLLTQDAGTVTATITWNG